MFDTLKDLSRAIEREDDLTADLTQRAAASMRNGDRWQDRKIHTSRHNESQATARLTLRGGVTVETAAANPGSNGTLRGLVGAVPSLATIEDELRRAELRMPTKGNVKETR